MRADGRSCLLLTHELPQQINYIHCCVWTDRPRTKNRRPLALRGGKKSFQEISVSAVSPGDALMPLTSFIEVGSAKAEFTVIRAHTALWRNVPD
jgi:hypothetical protein